MKFISGVYFGSVVTFCWNSQLWQNKRDNIVLFWVWKFVFATVMSTQGGVCMCIFFCSSSQAFSHHFKSSTFFKSCTASSLENSMGDTGNGSFVGFSQWDTNHRYKLSIHDGWVAGPVCSRVWACFLSHFYLAIWVHLYLWTSAFDTVLHLKQNICFICKFCVLFDSPWKIFLTISLLSKHKLE